MALTQESLTAGRQQREQFSTRWVFLLAAIGSAVGLGNIWRFPYVAYENGGGAFILPYMVALLTAGIPLLFFDYAIGHRFKGSPPLAFRRLNRWTEAIGWWQVMICAVLGLFYAAILAWATSYIWFSVTEAWGDDPEGFFFADYLQATEQAEVSFQIVPGVFFPLLALWILVLIILARGVGKGIGVAATIGMPLLVIMFVILVGIGLSLPGAATGLDALFTPDWSALTSPEVWVAAYGQIFFSLSVGFGIMLTYASYLKRRSNLTGSGLVVGFSNSGFELLAGIGVFSVLGFMAQASGLRVDEVASSGIGLAFVAFPAIISEAPLGLGPIIGVLFFGSLLFAGITSLISITEVVISGIMDKTGWSRARVVAIAGGLSAVVSLLAFSTTSGIHLLDVTDAFVNNIGIVGVSLVAVFVVSWVLFRLNELVRHLNSVSSFRLGWIYKILISVVMPVVLGITLVQYILQVVNEGYGGMPSWYVGTFGWGMSALMVVLAVVVALIPWAKNSGTQDDQHEQDFDIKNTPRRADQPGTTQEVNQ
ncbi:sodium-dependent transporter [Auritidibacter ignavus]|uniref:sodium-dependent transporter n=1 Tax=Auritidibacter ignavus TaxID=678932 RepID=UPI00109D23AA|nr:sodium-dependent transporter [Auritidibacter ignavus]